MCVEGKRGGKDDLGQISNNARQFWSVPANSCQFCLIKIMCVWDFPGGPVVKTPRFHCWGHGFDPWSGTKSPHAVCVFVCVCVCVCVCVHICVHFSGERKEQ